MSYIPWKSGDLNNIYEDEQEKNTCCVRLEHSIFFLGILKWKKGIEK